MTEILQEVLKRVRPGKKELARIGQLSQRLLDKASSDSSVNPLIVGSVAKGTFLKGADIDLFLKFKSGTDLKKEGLDAARKILPEGRELYAQHPYLRGEIDGVGLDVVPCYAIDDPANPISAVDRTPFHTEWVKQNIAGMEDQIRLAKQFLKGAGAYGAGAAVGGFSGYLVEILCIKYLGFTNLLKEMSGWRPPVKLGTVEGAPDSPIMLSDPVDKGRNVAAGVTLRGLGAAVLASKAFINEPALEFFFPKKIERRAKGHVTTVVIPHPGGNEETALPWLQRQGRKVYRAITDFEPIAWNANLGDSGFIVVETATVELPNIVPHKGPAPWDDGAMEFLKKYPDASLSGDRLEIGKPPRHSKIEEVILELLPKAEVKSGLGKGADPVQRVPWLD
ncbi:MAG: CCA tRNA nucleotidyltransferase [Candidatus Thermoplasmatota archaeon]|nr:CCA tRNA nucleotidyltransferase [Candidatus Thermoplasmatota archaeon]MEC9332796.1 CCA tRNA nucleotidyltransferase [Candidatus Thermoplasmatota archaeon]MED6305329.1 CCA tRNA nucleotidyltransferase [Candidatus Thermoplasmatota archaeon]MEE3242585.1 CCA tRNA nucleotidyltransferase [Candidatus Thermoplasmatota archaeon]